MARVRYGNRRGGEGRGIGFQSSVTVATQKKSTYLGRVLEQFRVLRNEADVEAAHVHLLWAVGVRIAWVRHYRAFATTTAYRVLAYATTTTVTFVIVVHATTSFTVDHFRFGVRSGRQQGGPVYLATAAEWIGGGQQRGR